ncbi:MAG: Crp/Fnr family transcriptional regulator [Lentimicrobiaceae bacterium]|nr:Crp/Fnr family transcriptional regulator [Lentimicrobiaceae bacterium]
MNKDLLYFCSFCRDKTDDEIAKIKCTIEHSRKTYKRGEYVAYQGDDVSYLFMLTKGSVKTEMVADSGLTIPISEIFAPYPLAAALLFADDNRFPVDVIALEECEILRITKDSVEKQMAKCPGFLRGFMAFNANSIQFLSERLKIYAQKGIKAKVAYYILKHSKQGRFEFGKSIASLASYFGVERPSLSRALSEMSRDGIIEFKNGAGRILDFNKLKELI